MERLAKFVLVLFMFTAFTAVSAAHVQAAPSGAPATTNLKVKVSIDQADVFWKCTFLTRDADVGKPTDIKVAWSVGQLQGKEKTQTVIAAGKSTGEVSIAAEKGALVNIEVSVRDAKGIKYGYTSLQVRNNGQTENITISPPESSEPKITWGNL